MYLPNANLTQNFNRSVNLFYLEAQTSDFFFMEAGEYIG